MGLLVSQWDPGVQRSNLAVDLSGQQVLLVRDRCYAAYLGCALVEEAPGCQGLILGLVLPGKFCGVRGLSGVRKQLAMAVVDDGGGRVSVPDIGFTLNALSYPDVCAGTDAGPREDKATSQTLLTTSSC